MSTPTVSHGVKRKAQVCEDEDVDNAYVDGFIVMLHCVILLQDGTET
jgi:hypothetical protein